MALKIGITGGIGTGKSFVSKIFKTMGIPVYDADYEAKSIMTTNAVLREKLVNAFGSMVYHEDGTLNRKWLSGQVFENETKLNLLNSIVHPIVIAEGQQWADKQTAPYSIKEAALLVESNSYKLLDFTIVVTAPLSLRIQRVMSRDQTSEENVMHRIKSQMSDEEKERVADFVIVNDESSSLLSQIEKIHRTLIARTNA